MPRGRSRYKCLRESDFCDHNDFGQQRQDSLSVRRSSAGADGPWKRLRRAPLLRAEWRSRRSAFSETAVFSRVRAAAPHEHRGTARTRDRGGGALREAFPEPEFYRPALEEISVEALRPSRPRRHESMEDDGTVAYKLLAAALMPINVI